MHFVVLGGNDAGISAALRARELSPATDVTVADRFPDLSISTGARGVTGPEACS